MDTTEKILIALCITMLLGFVSLISLDVTNAKKHINQIASAVQTLKKENQQIIAGVEMISYQSDVLAESFKEYKNSEDIVKKEAEIIEGKI